MTIEATPRPFRCRECGEPFTCDSCGAELLAGERAVVGGYGRPLAVVELGTPEADDAIGRASVDEYGHRCPIRHRSCPQEVARAA